MKHCEGCGVEILDPVDEYGEENWTLCRSCDWEHQAEWKFDDTRRTIDAGRQTTFLGEEGE